MTKATNGGKSMDLGITLNAGQIAKAAFALASAALASAAILAASSANAQGAPGYANQFSQPYGGSSASMMMPYDAGSRDLNANRVVIDGVITNGVDYSSGLLGSTIGSTGMGYSGVTGYAIGNQLNVSASGSFNTVIVNSSQINNGNQTVVINGNTTCGTTTCPTTTSNNSTQILNGGLNF